jgi:type II secretory pathway component PulF
MALSLFSAWSELDIARYKAEFYRMWLAGYSAGLTHPQSLAAMGDFRRSPTLHFLHQHLLDGTRRGDSLASLVRGGGGRPSQLPRAQLVPFESALIELGEESGRLEESFRLLADYFTAEHRMVLRVKKDLAYPMVSTCAATLIAPFPILFFGNVPLYILTVVGEYAIAFAAGGTLLLAVARWYGKRPKFVLGRLCRALAAGVEAGLSLDRVVMLAARASGHPDLLRHVERMTARQRSTQQLAETFRGAPMIPFEVVAALEVADASGNYRDTLGKLAALYDGAYQR